MHKKLLEKKELIQLISYLFVGAGATIVEWVFFWLFNGKLNIHYEVSTVIAMLLSTLTNWWLGRVLTFKDSKISIFKEIVSIYAASTLGILFNMLLMWAFVDKLFINNMIAKMIATGIVFIYNYLIRKLFIYKKNNV